MYAFTYIDLTYENTLPEAELGERRTQVKKNVETPDFDIRPDHDLNR